MSENWIVRAFGINKMNFLGWSVVGGAGMVATFILLVDAGKEVFATNANTTDKLLFVIALVLIMSFGLMLQKYTALYAEKARGKERDLRSEDKLPRGERASGG
jgi:hypothetical protein